MKRMTSIVALTGILSLVASSAEAATTVTITNAARSGDNLVLTGTSTYDDQAFVTMGTDAANDAFTPAPVGQDLVSAAIRTKANGDIEFRWTLSMLPPAIGGVPFSFYGWSFCAGEDSCYEVDAGRFYDGPTQTAASGLVWQCADATCAVNGQTATSIPVAVTMDTTTNTVIARVPGSQLGAPGGTTITPVQVSPFGPAFTAVYESYQTGNVYLDYGDGVPFDQEYVVPKKEVSFAVGAPTADPASLTYGAPVNVSASGGFSGSVNVAGLVGAHGAFARACFAGTCAYGSRPVAL